MVWVLTIALSFVMCAGAVSISSCPAVITNSSTLSANLTSNGTCIIFNNDNITLDCSGFTITGDGTGYGINISNRTNAIVKNCIVDSFDRNILLENSNNSFVLNNTWSNSSVIGFQMSGVLNTVAKGNVGHDNTDRGFSDEFGANNTVTDNIAYGNSVYGMVLNSDNSTVENNTVYNNGAIGIITSSAGTLVANCVSYNNTEGFFIEATARSVFRNNTAYNNTEGFFIQASSSITIANNTAFNNSRGFNLKKGASTNVTFSNNLAFQNTVAGFSSLPGKGFVDGNLWLNNIAHDNPIGFVIGTTSSVSPKSAHNNRFINNTAYNGVTGFIDETGFASNNEFLGNLAYNFSSEAFLVSSTTSVNLTNNTAYNNTIGYHIDSSSFVALTNNSARDSSVGFYDVASDSDSFTNNTASNNTYGLSFDAATNENFSNTTLLDNGIAVYLFDFSSTNNFADTLIRSSLTWIFADAGSSLNNFTNTTFETAAGSIRIPSNATLPDPINVSTAVLNVSLNKAFLNSTYLPFFNTSARITLTGLPLANPVPLVDFTDSGMFVSCAAPQCVVISASPGALTFTVASFSTYAAGNLALGPGGGGGGGGGSTIVHACPVYCANPRYQKTSICQSPGCQNPAPQNPSLVPSVKSTTASHNETTPRQTQNPPVWPKYSPLPALPLRTDDQISSTQTQKNRSLLGFLIVFGLAGALLMMFAPHKKKKHRTH